jgi:hypothetical protein
MPPRHVLAAGCLIAVVAGCGGGQKPPSDEQQVTTALRSFLRAQADGDAQKACALLTAGAQSKLVAVVARRAQGLGAAPRTCDEAVGLVRAVAPQALLRAFRDARVQRVVVHDRAATARVVDGPSFPAQRVALARSDGGWQISAVPSLIGG